MKSKISEDVARKPGSNKKCGRLRFHRQQVRNNLSRTLYNNCEEKQLNNNKNTYLHIKIHTKVHTKMRL